MQADPQRPGTVGEHVQDAGLHVPPGPQEPGIPASHSSPGSMIPLPHTGLLTPAIQLLLQAS